MIFNRFKNNLYWFVNYKAGCLNVIFAAMNRYAHDAVTPLEHSSLSKKEQVAGMFDDIAGRYDLLNRVLSGGIDRGWRKKALAELELSALSTLLDVASGTADVAIMAAEKFRNIQITGIDISEGMLDIGRQKIKSRKLENTISLMLADSESIPFEDNHFDAVTVAFGVRNFQHLEKGLSEIRRVLKPGGKLVVLEFSKPENRIFLPVYQAYRKWIAPGIGSLLSKQKKAYQYLDKSIEKFPEGKVFLNVLTAVGFKHTYLKKLSLGICSIYCGNK
jgi:demethylmenaquinone methyltransferase/2-methoxy-6-polyprenyl-1,4-benzoquinol methylase